MVMVVVPFLVYTAFCYWLIVMDGAESLGGLESFFLLGWFASSLTPTELKFYVGISWVVSLGFVLFSMFSGPTA
jgi:hypothetical protein